jgi:hypothetical protein
MRRTIRSVALGVGMFVAVALAPAAAEPTATELVPSNPGTYKRYGAGCAVEGDVAAVGNSPWFEGASVCVFRRSGGTWQEEVRIGPGFGNGVATAGPAVAIDGGTLVAHGNSDGSDGPAGGVVFAFVHDGTAWTRQGTLRTDDASTEGVFGSSIAISGDTVVVGDDMNDAAATDAGAAYVFVRTDGTWTKQARLTASDAEAEDYFGSSVAVSGDTIVVGAPAEDEVAYASGAAYVFERSGTTWTQKTKLIAGDAAYYDQFGTTVAAQGDMILVGAQFEDRLGRSAGTVYTYIQSGGNWFERQWIHASDGAELAMFGSALSISGQRAAVGAVGHASQGKYTGAVYILHRDGWDWHEEMRLTAPDAAAGDQLGDAVALDGYTLAVGAAYDMARGDESGTAWVLDVSPPTVTTSAAMLPDWVVLTLPATGKAPATPGLKAHGTLELGSATADLALPGVLSIGSRQYAIDHLAAADGVHFKYSDATVTFSVTVPKTGCSKATFDLAVRDDLTGVVDPSAAFSLGYVTNDLNAGANVPLEGGRFKLGSDPTALGARALHCAKAAATLTGAGRDTFSMSLLCGGDGTVPTALPAVVVGFGDVFRETLDPARLVLKKGKWVYSNAKASGVTSATFDFAKGTVKVAGRRADLGAFEQGAVPLTLTLWIGEDRRASDVRAVVKKKALRY